MKRKIKLAFCPIVTCILCFVLFLFTSCDEDENIVVIENENTTVPEVITKGRFYTKETTPRLVSNKLNNSLELIKRRRNNRASMEDSGSIYSTAFGEILTNEVLEIENENGIRNYTYTVIVNDGNPKTFYNLIVSKDAEDNFREPYLKKYTMSDEFYAEFLNGSKTMEEFEGKFINYNISENLNLKELTGYELNRSQASSNPCDNIIQDYKDDTGTQNDSGGGSGGGSGSGSGGGPGGGPGGPIGTGGGSSDGSSNSGTGGKGIVICWSTVEKVCVGHEPGHACGGIVEVVTVTCGDSYKESYSKRNRQNKTSSMNNCPEDNGGVGVLTNLAYNFFYSSLSADLKSYVDANYQVKNVLNDYFNQYGNKAGANDVLKEVLTLFRQEVLNPNIDALAFILNAYGLDMLDKPMDPSFMVKVNPILYPLIANAALRVQVAQQFTINCAVLRKNHPEWSDIKIAWEASKEMVHLTLDVFGMVPLIGEPADLLNGVLYTIEGDGVNATLSFAALIPVFGSTGTGSRIALKIVGSNIGSKTLLTWEILENGIVKFGNNKTLRKILKLTDSAIHAHHLIPKAFKELDIIQKAAKSGSHFHIHEALNGIPRPKSLHLTGHNKYNDVIEEILENANPNFNNNQAYNFVEGLANHLRELIEANPNLNSGQIADLINYP